MQSGGRRKKSSRPRLPPIDTSNTAAAVYESLDADYNGIPLDYTYPTPSPTVKYDPESDTAYTYIPHKGSAPSSNGKIEPTVNNVNGDQRNIYHSIGPDVVQHYEFDTNGGGGGLANGAIPVNNGGMNHHYHCLEAQLNGQPTTNHHGDANGAVVYEYPTLPKFRVKSTQCTPVHVSSKQSPSMQAVDIATPATVVTELSSNHIVVL